VAGQADAFKALSGIKGLDFNALNATAGDPKKLESLKKALESFKDGQSFEEANKKVKDLGDELKRLETAAAGLRKTVETGERVQSRDVGLEVQRQALAPFGFAAGGNVFRPKGTDTVPAMLTPGEYVVNALSSQANLSLLERINRARGPVYRDAGGLGRQRFAALALWSTGPFLTRRPKERIRKWQEEQRRFRWSGGRPLGRSPYRAGGGVIEIPDGVQGPNRGQRPARPGARPRAGPGVHRGRRGAHHP
jgi:hypothetical protein